MGTTPLPWLLRVPPAAVSVKFSVALMPPTVMEAPTPVPFTAAKLATLPPVNALVKGPAAVAPHLEALSALPSPAKNWSAASTATTPTTDRAKRDAARKTQTPFNEPGFLRVESGMAAFIDFTPRRELSRPVETLPPGVRGRQR